MINPKKNIIIADLDGTIALIDHRRPMVTNGNRDWAAFHAACVDDTPNVPVISLLREMYDVGYIINIFSGRNDVVREETEQWLRDHEVPHDSLIMRQQGDHTRDEELKRSWITPGLRDQVLFILDDRDRVVNMWRDEGFTCMQVAPGDF
jgi:hypothetical protein